MKLSVKLQDDQQRRHKSLDPLITAKIPISILKHPFLTSISTNSLSSDLSLSLSSNFSSGPSLRLSYCPTSTTPSFPPFSLCLKSGLGVFGSPSDSPLVFKAHFSFSSRNPVFSLHFKPQFGDFALKKTAFSNPRSGGVRNSGSKPGIEVNSEPGSGSNVEIGNGFPSEGSSVWQDVKLEPCGGGRFDGGRERSLDSKETEKDGFFTGIALMARTVFPVGKKLEVNMRWGVNLGSELGAKMPRLTMNKIAIERVESESEAKENGSKKKTNVDSPDLEMLKGMCFWMSRDLEAMERENKQIKCSLEQMTKLGVRPGDRSPLPNSEPREPPSESSSEKLKYRKSVKEEEPRREAKRASYRPGDLESELQRAIAAAAAGSSTK